MILWLLAACLKPAPAPAAPAAALVPQPPPPVVARIDGWSLLQADGQHYWTELWDEAASQLATDALAAGATLRPTLAGPPDRIAEIDRRFLQILQAPARPRAWQFTPGQSAVAELSPASPELVAVEPVADRDGALGLRAWFRPLGSQAAHTALTGWTSTGEAPTGFIRGITPCPCAGCTHGCTTLPLTEGSLVAEAATERGPASASLHFDHGGIRWFASHAAEPALPVGWFGRGDARWLIVQPTSAPEQRLCLARFPETDQPIVPSACVRDSPAE